MTRIDLQSLDAIVFDFDGVLTDDRVYVDRDGKEMVCCTRTDGIAFDVLRAAPLKLFILTTEKNPVVARRAAKLKVPVFQGAGDKLAALKRLARGRNFSIRRTLFVGNDVNDYFAMKACGFSVCPADAHPAIRRIANLILKKTGGQGVVREIVEQVLGLDALQLWHENVGHARTRARGRAKPD
jgi:YrbI family 3-deoxy-D-manno-octulosonate 8-phosphate phosphatase